MRSFDSRDIRSSMDVYTLDNAYLGTVLDIAPGPQSSDDRLVPESARQSSEINGEMLGPMPTQSIGNHGPRVQSADNQYAATPDQACSIGQGAITVGNWWGLRGRRVIPLEAVQAVSLERVVLKLKKAEIEDGIFTQRR